MAASVDYLFAYDATTNLIADYQYVAVSEALVFDEENRSFLEEHNPAALEEVAERLLEAAQRGLWEECGDYQGRLQGVVAIQRCRTWGLEREGCGAWHTCMPGLCRRRAGQPPHSSGLHARARAKASHTLGVGAHMRLTRIVVGASVARPAACPTAEPERYHV